MKGFKALVGLVILIVLVINLFPVLMDLIKSEDPDNPKNSALYEAWENYEWTLDVDNPYTKIVPLNNMKNQFAVETGSGKWGVIDCYGNEVVQLKKDALQIKNDAAEGIYAIALDATEVGVVYRIRGSHEIKVWGFIDQSGDFFINPRFTQVQMFTGNYAAVREESVWQVVNKEDDIVYSFNEGEVVSRTSSEGVFWVEGNGKHGLVNIVTSEYTHMEEQPVLITDSSNTTPVKYDTAPLKASYNFNNENGYKVSDRVFDSFVTTKDGYAIVRKDFDYGYRMGIIKLEPLEN